MNILQWLENTNMSLAIFLLPTISSVLKCIIPNVTKIMLKHMELKFEREKLEFLPLNTKPKKRKKKNKNKFDEFR